MPPYHETGVAIPLSHCVSCSIADYRCYTQPLLSVELAYRSPKTGLTTGGSRKKLASEAYRAVGGVARNNIANRARAWDTTLRLLNALNSEDRGLKVRFSLATIVFETFELILCQMLSSHGKNAPSNPYPHYLVRLAASR